MNDIAKAEHLAAVRITLFGLMAVFLVFQLWIGTGPGVWRAAAWAVTVLCYGLALSGFGGWLHSRRVRDLLDDEATRDHRDAAMRSAFWGGLLASIAIAVAAQSIAIDTYFAARAITVCALVPGLIVFAWRERRALRSV